MKYALFTALALVSTQAFAYEYKYKINCSVESYQQLVQYREGTDYCKNTGSIYGTYNLTGETSTLDILAQIGSNDVKLSALTSAATSAGFESKDKQLFWQFEDGYRHLSPGIARAVFLWRYTNYGAGFCKYDLRCTIAKE